VVGRFGSEILGYHVPCFRGKLGGGEGGLIDTRLRGGFARVDKGVD